MVISNYKFNAIAITYVGNYRGSCLIRLNGQAIIIVRDNGAEINQWPYNCIRQFRAEDETEKFSFVSGRRGPFGVAEYNFSVPNNSLIALQSALTEFTGAQFSAVAPGSGTEQQPLQLQQPLPQLPSTVTLPRLPSSNAINSYATTTGPPRHMTLGGGGGGRNETIISDRYVDSVLPLPEHQLPQLPPRRDYNTRANTSSDLNNTIPLSYSADEHTLRGLNNAVRGTPKSGSASDLHHSSMRPGLALPRRDLKEPSPEAMVAVGYEQHVPKGKSPAHSPPVIPKKKKKSFMDRFKTSGTGNDGREETKTNSESLKKSIKSTNDLKEEEPETSLDDFRVSKSLHRPKTEPVLTNGTATKARGERRTQESTLKKGEEEKYVQMSPKVGKKESPYDHLPSEKDDVLQIPTDSPPTAADSSNNTSTDSTDGKKSPFLEDFSDLDHTPRSRSSPITKTRSITPEYAHRLRMMGEDGLSNGGVSTLPAGVGRQSPPGKISRRSNTVPHHSSGEILSSREPPVVPSDVTEDGDSSLYNVPRTLSAADVYNVPKSILESPPRGRRSESDSQTYDVPRADQSNLDGVGVRLSQNAIEEDDGLYKVPTSISALAGQTYDAPRGLMKESDDNVYNTPCVLIKESDDINVYNTPHGLKQESDDVYNTPRGLIKESDDVYNTPRGLIKESDDVDVYSVPRTTSSLVSGSEPDLIYNQPRPVGPITPKNNSANINSAPRYSYETIEIPEETRTMRPSRSFESLHRARIDPQIHETGYSKGHISPPPTGRGVYIDIDLERGLKPAKNAPLPPLPVLAAGGGGGGQDLIVESVYAEIPEHSVSRGNSGITSPHPNSSSSQNPYRVNGGGDPYYSPTRGGTYSELPPPRPNPQESYAQEGLSEQRKLASEGYEFCSIASDRIRSQSFHANHRVRVQDSSYPPTTTATTAEAILEKYHINIYNSTPPRSRHYSESNVLDGPSSGLLGTSTPLDDPLSDEYVIVTGPDTRPKTGPTLPRNVPAAGGVVTTVGAPSSSTIDENDEYELMSSAFVDQAKLRSTNYSTPNPSLGGYSSSNNNAPTNSATTYTHQYNTTARSSPGRDLQARSHTPPKSLRNSVHDDSMAGVNLDSMSPADSNGVPMYSHVTPMHQRLCSSVSTTSSTTSEVTEEEEEGEVSGMTIEGVSDKRFENVNVGSPLDRTNSVELRNRTRSLGGNILENSIATTTTTAGTTTGTTTPTPGSPPTNTSKEHNYINIIPQDPASDQKERSLTMTPNNRKKGPKPLPRSSILLRENSLTM